MRRDRTMRDAIEAAGRLAELARRPEGFSSAQVCELTGVTYRQLTYWNDTHLLEPSIRRVRGPGSAHVYSLEDVARARVMAGLIEVGFDVAGLRAYSWEQRADLLKAVRAVIERVA